MLRNLLRRSPANRLIAGAPNIGIIASQIIAETETGDQGSGLLYDEALTQTGRQLRIKVTSWTGTPGVLFVYENGSLLVEGQADGAYSIGYDWEAWAADGGLNSGSDTATVTIGVVNATAPGATVTGTGTVSGGSADGQGNATASGADVTGAGSVSGGAASGEQNATAPGADVSGSGTVYGGDASGGSSGDATAPGANVTGSGSFVGGDAIGEQNATAPGADVTGTGSTSGGQASGDVDATAPGGTVTGTGSVQAGTASNGSNNPPTDHVLRSAVARIAGIAVGLPSPASFCLGETIRIALQVTDMLGNEVDPPQITLRIKRPGQSPVSVVPTRAQTGQYFADLLLDQKGHWYFHAESTVPHPAVYEGHFTVTHSRFMA